MTKTNKEEEKEKLRQELGRPLTVAEAGEVNLKYDVKKNKQPRGASVGYRNLMNKMDRYYNGGE